MKAARADQWGTFSSVTPYLAKVPAPLRPGKFCLSEKGLTFRSMTRLAPWTEVDVELELPPERQIKRRRIRCNAVVVECCPAPFDHGYDVTLLFLELDRRSLSELTQYSRLQTYSAAQCSAAFSGARV